MSWTRSIAVAILTSLASLGLSGVVASFATDWYHITSFEGASGYFIVGMALLGLAGGLAIGLVTARVVASRPRAGFLKALGLSLAVLCGVLGASAGVARLLADVPPEIDGEELFLLVELRWPSAGGADPGALAGAPLVRLGATSGSTMRVDESGPLFLDDATRSGGRLIVPGVVRVFTSRGGRVLTFTVGTTALGGFVLPLPAFPGAESRQWSQWYPSAAPGQPPLPDQFTFRYRVVRQSEPVRTATRGGFQIGTVVSGFRNVNGTDSLAARSQFQLRYRGQPVAGLDEVNAVAVVGGTRPAIVVAGSKDGESDSCHLLVDAGKERAEDLAIGRCTPGDAQRLTSDVAQFRASRSKINVPGWVDGATFATPGLYRVGDAVLDTEALTAARFTPPSEPTVATEVPPLTVSPDTRSFVWFAHQGEHSDPVLIVTDWKASRSYILPIDRTRQRYASDKALDPAWVAYHFEWRPGSDGVMTLAERTPLVPLPYRGELQLGKPGEYQSYLLEPAGHALRDAIVELLVTDLHGERLPDDAGHVQLRVRVRGKTFSVMSLESPNYVSVSMDSAESDPTDMTSVGASIDAALSTGRYDALFAEALKR